MVTITPDGQPPHRPIVRGSASVDLAICPFTILVDDREQLPWRFGGIASSVGTSGAPIAVKTVRRRLDTGDYSLLNHEAEIAIERKSLDDIYTTLGQGRDRFENEHERMAAIVAAGGYACVLIESTVEEAVCRPPIWSRLNPNSVIGTWHAWEMRYRVPWVWCGDRRMAELICYGKLDMWWRQNVRGSLRGKLVRQGNGNTTGESKGEAA
jgi:ERCC4-type nuclease